jgi:cytosine/adenosine deaminase-related metal-dependent hydrolase
MVGLASMMMTRRFQRLGDLVCGTVVVVEERQWLSGMAALDDPFGVLVYNASGRDVTHVMVDGALLVADRRLAYADTSELIRDAERLGVRRFAFWRLGQEDPAVWVRLRAAP